ncbi:MAG: hypothetical protein WCD37_16005 [Chloroflexia bacterium]
MPSLPYEPARLREPLRYSGEHLSALRYVQASYGTRSRGRSLRPATLATFVAHRCDRKPRKGDSSEV